jgi:zinc resistance-associated protein
MIMVRRLPAVVAVIALMGTGFVSTAFAGNDEDTTSKVQATAPNEMLPHLSAQDRAAFLDARIAALHAGLELTADQEKLWPSVDSALRDFCKVIKSQREKFREDRPMDMMSLLEMRSGNLVARGDALKQLVDASKPLYATLSDAQKQRLRILVYAIFRPFGHRHFAMEGGWGHGMMERGMTKHDTTTAPENEHDDDSGK